MLLEITIKNFAIIEEISLNFENGMTVLTGETGAGKSIIIDAMNLMLGARASSEVVRHSASKAEIQGFFSIEQNPSLVSILEDNGIPVEDELIIRREIFQNGRSVSRINGQMVNLTTLKAVGHFLVDIHGQHDQEELMKPALHITMLDAFGDKEFFQTKKEYQVYFDRYRELRKAVLEKQKNEQEHKARIEMLAFQIAEIEAVSLKSGEDLALMKERDKLLNHKQIADTLTNAYVMLDNEDFSSLSNVRSAMNDLQSLEEYDSDYKELSGNLSEAYYVLEDVTKQLEKDLLASAETLQTARHQIATALEAEIKNELCDLYMDKADFKVTFTKGKFNRDGNEQVEFYISTNPGEGFKPLVKVASGGELSRLMLAIKSAFARKEDKTSIVFDEVDTGVSGRVAQAIAQKIHKIGSHGQVLAISHLPQVIAIADYQFFISKESDNETTVSRVRLLTPEERVQEIAKMLAGDNVTEAALSQARALLKVDDSL